MKVAIKAPHEPLVWLYPAEDGERPAVRCGASRCSAGTRRCMGQGETEELRPSAEHNAVDFGKMAACLEGDVTSEYLEGDSWRRDSPEDATRAAWLRQAACQASSGSELMVRSDWRSHMSESSSEDFAGEPNFLWRHKEARRCL